MSPKVDPDALPVVRLPPIFTARIYGGKSHGGMCVKTGVNGDRVLLHTTRSQDPPAPNTDYYEGD